MNSKGVVFLQKKTAVRAEIHHEGGNLVEVKTRRQDANDRVVGEYEN